MTSSGSRISISSRSLWEAVLLIVGGLLTLVPYARIFRGWLPGDIGDARWTISLHESWYLTLRGELGIGETLFYFPYADAKGMSDIFLPQSLVYSALRVFDTSPISAWLLSTLSFGGLLSLSLFFIARKTFRSTFGFAAFFLIATTAFNFHAEMGHVQTAAYSLAFTFVAVALPPRAGQRDWLRNLRPLALAVLVSALVLATWYGFVFLLLILAIFAILGFTLNRGFIKAQTVRSQYNYPIWSWLVAVTALLPSVLLWLILYGPHLGTSDSRSWGEYLIYAPRTADFLNPSRTQSFWGELLNNWGTFSPIESGERSMGIALVTLFGFLIIGALYVARGFLARRTSPFSIEAIVALTVLATIALFVVMPSGFSLYWFFWELVPGAQTIRAPMRVTILLVPAMLWVIFRYLEAKWILERESVTEHSPRRLAAIGLLTVLIFIEQQTAINSDWRRPQFLAVEAKPAKQALEAANCEAFVLNDVRAFEKPWWQAEIDAVALATSIDIPTVNGYSAFAPEGYAWNSESHTANPAAAEAKRAWATAQTDAKVCILYVAPDGAVEVRG